MEVLYGIPCLAVIILIFVSRKENVSNVAGRRVFNPFYKIIKNLSRIPFIRKALVKWVALVCESYKVLYSIKDAEKMARMKCFSILAEGLAIITAASFLAVIFSFSQATELIDTLNRKETGDGSITYELRAQIQGEKRIIPVQVQEQEYSEEEVNEWFDYGSEHIHKLILGENKSLDDVTENLDLVSKLPGSEIEVSWECNNYSLIDPSGELNIKNLSTEGRKVKLTAIFTYGDFERREEINIVVKKKEYEGIDGKFNALQETIEKEETKERTAKAYSLPDEIMGEKVIYTEKKSPVGLVILILAIIVICLLPFEEKALLDKKKQEKYNCMLLEYPELVCKLSLYLGAGMTISKSWERIALAYIKQSESLGRRSYSNEEVVYTYRQLESGVLKQAAFEEFGNRCRLQPYKKLSLLIISNIRKGASDLSDILSIESREALDSRKSTVIKLAGEASAKLMLPMVLELGVVIGILIIPAFMSISL